MKRVQVVPRAHRAVERNTETSTAITDSRRRPCFPTTPIRGRPAHLATVDHLVARLRRTLGAVLVVEGPPGIGKSRMLQELRLRAAHAGARVLSARCYEDQQSTAFGPILAATLRADPPLIESTALKNFSSRADLGLWLMAELHAVITAASAVTPLLVTIDDLHWADAGSLGAIRTLVSGLVEEPVLWALAARPDEGRSAVGDALDAVTTHSLPYSHRMRLTALEPDAVAQVATDILHADPDDDLLHLTTRSRGNPFLVVELLHGLQEEGRIRIDEAGASVLGPGLPNRLTKIVQQRLDRLSEPARQLVQVASVLPDSFSAALLARMLNRKPSEIVGPVEEAVRADLVTEDAELLTFRHDLLRQAARSSMSFSLRQALERQSAECLLDMGAGPVDVAVQLARSAAIGDSVAVKALRNAAESLARSDPSKAADLALRAVGLLAHNDCERPAVVAETVERLFRAARPNEARELAAATMTNPLPEEAEARIRLSLSTASQGYTGRRVEENRRALELASVSDRTRAMHMGYLAHHMMSDGQPRQARRAARNALEAAVGAGDRSAQMLAEIVLANLDCAEGRGRRCLERLSSLQTRVDDEDEQTALVVASHRANLFVTLGCLREADEIFGEWGGATVRLRHAEGRYVLTRLRAARELVSGQLLKARASIESLPEEQRSGHQIVAAHIGTVTMAALAARTGDRRLQQLLSDVGPSALSPGPTPRRESAVMQAHFAWQRGHVSDAAQWLGEDVELLGTPPSPTHVDDVVLAVRVAVRSGHAGLRQRVLAVLETLENEDPAVALYAGVALSVRGLLGQDVDALRAAADTFARCGRPLLQAEALEDLGDMLTTAAGGGSAIDALNAALDIFSQCGSTADGRRVARTLRRHGVHRRVVRPRPSSGKDSLTPSEWRVMELVAQGAANRDVAQRLSVSPHTVNTHLRKVYAKMGVHSRAELVMLVHTGRSPDGAAG